MDRFAGARIAPDMVFGLWRTRYAKVRFARVRFAGADRFAEPKVAMVRFTGIRFAAGKDCWGLCL